jgi:predicted dehydrogenase
MLAECALDAVVVATPASTHQQVGLAALEAGVATLMEKPLAATVDEATSLVDVASSRGVPLQVGHIERFNPALHELERQLRRAGHARLLRIETTRWSPSAGRPLDMGVAMDLATHDLDLICHLAAESPVRVFAETSRNVDT